MKIIQKRYSNKEIDNIVKDYLNGMELYKIAQKYNRTSSSIINKLKSIGIFKNKNYRFSNKDIEFLIKYYPVCDWSVIDKYFEDRDPKPSRQSIRTKMSELNIVRECKKWNKHDIDILKEYYNKIPINKICMMLDVKRTNEAICLKADKLGLKIIKKWSIEEENILKKYYENIPMLEIMKLLPNRSRSAICIHAKLFRLKSFDRNLWTEEEDKYIIENWELKSDYLMAKELNRTQRATAARRMYLNCYRRDMGRINYESIQKYLRGQISYWKTDSMKKCNYRCVLTGSKDFQIHHINNFSIIIDRVFKKYNFELKEFNEYSDEELSEIKKCFLIEHKKEPLGVCVRKDIHELFHYTYGHFMNNQEQWDVFIKDYKDGLYKNYKIDRNINI